MAYADERSAQQIQEELDFNARELQRANDACSSARGATREQLFKAEDDIQALAKASDKTLPRVHEHAQQLAGLFGDGLSQCKTADDYAGLDDLCTKALSGLSADL